MNIKGKWNRGVSQLLDSIQRFEPSGHPDLVDVLSEAPHVADDVDVSKPGQHGLADRSFLLFDLCYSLLELMDLAVQAVFLCLTCHSRFPLGFLQ